MENKEDHFSSDKNHWCLVNYLGNTPFYYTGWFGKNNGDQNYKPGISIDFNEALKLHSKIAAEQVLNGLKNCSGVDANFFKIEDHAWM